MSPCLRWPIDRLHFRNLRTLLTCFIHTGEALYALNQVGLVDRLFENGDETCVIVLEGDKAFRRTRDAHRNRDAVDDLPGIFAHQARINGKVGLAFGAIRDKIVDFQVFRGIELYMGRKRGATHADDTGRANARERFIPGAGKRIDQMHSTDQPGIPPMSDFPCVSRHPGC